MYQGEQAETEPQAAELVKQAYGFIPADFLDWFFASNEIEIDYELSWVRVPDPNSNGNHGHLEIRPVVWLYQGETEKEGAAEPIEPGPSGLSLVQRLPGGKETTIGTLDAPGGDYQPTITMLTKNGCKPEAFLTIAKLALAAQKPTA